LLIRAIDLKYPLWALIASLSFLAGIMSKEVVLFFYPAGCFLVWRWPSTSEKVVTFLRLKIIAWFSLPFLGILIWYIAARLERFGGRDVGFNFVFEKYSYDFFNTIRVIFKVLGFYTKKIFLPLPLNFAITSASEHYIWLGLVVLLSLPLLIWLRCIWVDFLLVSFFLMVPGVIIALTNVAWTPLAERYIYLSSAFGAVFACGLVKYIKRYMPDKTWTMYIPVLGVFLMIGVITYQRNQVWQSNLTLFEDTVRKNPGFPSAQNELATALLRAGRNDEARDLWGAAQVEASISNPHQVHFNYVRSLIRDAGFKAAWAAFHNLQNRREIHSLKFLKEDAKICESMLQTFKEEWQEKLIIADLLVIYQKIMKKSSDPFVCYRAGQIAMFNGKPKLAGRYFNEAYQKAPASAHYRAAAEKLADTLKRKGND
jgi:tetratricopeptide (TPR) repeat protein